MEMDFHIEIIQPVAHQESEYYFSEYISSSFRKFSWLLTIQ